MFGQQDQSQENKPSNLKRYLIIGGVAILLLVALGLIVKSIFFSTSKEPNNSQENNQALVTDLTTDATNTIAGLPVLDLLATSSDSIPTIDLTDIAIEYMSFEDFYQAPEKSLATTTFADYTLPLNIKMDVANYYALSRKLNLDTVIDDLNNDGVALIDNPWPKEARDFYALYDNLETRQIPLLISADFIIYDYQNTLKKVYKDIEENVFYSNLWHINKELYLLAKGRYEARLSAIGDINDSLLEAARLQTVFFSVALELLKPDTNQISAQGAISGNGQFSTLEADKFYFLAPLYVRDDVLKEVALIKAAKENAKSPTMLYRRDYKEFAVPSEYGASARLRNLYLSMKWLNSVFPLNYRDDKCPECLLDREDWRLTTIAAAFISNDFSSSPELKNKWARIYKLMTFFNPTRDDLNYVFYRDALREVFGADYDLEKLFVDHNGEAQNNLQKLRAHLDAKEFSPFLGALDKTKPAWNALRGFKVLSLPYSPSAYVFTNLTYPLVDTYQGGDTRLENNITNCNLEAFSRRCNGIALDFINLISPISNHAYFQENANYLNYQNQATSLKNKLDADIAWRTNNYWSTLAYLDKYLNSDTHKQPLFTRSLKWRDYQLNTAVGAWVNAQLPLESFSKNQAILNDGLSNFAKYHEYSYIEPNLDLLDELLATNLMMSKMLTALQVDKEVPSVFRLLQDLSVNLETLRAIVIKELTGEALDENDNAAIVNFAKKLRIDSVNTADKNLAISFPYYKNDLKEDLSQFKLKVLIHQESDGQFISVGPVWDYKESR